MNDRKESSLIVGQTAELGRLSPEMLKVLREADKMVAVGQIAVAGRTPEVLPLQRVSIGECECSVGATKLMLLSSTERKSTAMSEEVEERVLLLVYDWEVKTSEKTICLCI